MKHRVLRARDNGVTLHCHQGAGKRKPVHRHTSPRHRRAFGRRKT
jgi:hypothetical protein